MMEKEPTFEENETPEQQLVRLLKEKGVQYPEVREFLDNWTREQEKKVEQTDDPEAPIKFNLLRARLYFKAGYVEEAFENFEAARMQAWNEGRDELYQSIMEEMNQIEESMKNQK